MDFGRRRELEYVQHQLEQFISRRAHQQQPIWGKLLGRGVDEDAKDALAIGGLSSRIQKVVTVYQVSADCGYLIVLVMTDVSASWVA